MTRSRLLLLVLSATLPLLARTSATAQSLHGTVVDPLGARVQSAVVEILAGTPADTVLSSTRTGLDGDYRFTTLPPHAARVRLSAPTFRTTLRTFAVRNGDQALDVTLETPTRSDEITVTATGVPIPLAQASTPVTVLTPQNFPEAREIQEPLRLIPGVQLTQTGQTGGTSTLFIRGGESSYNKVLLDGAPVNDIGGEVDFANVAAVGISRLEVLREPSSVLYGSDALAGVVSLSTTRGSTAQPVLDYAVDGGSFNALNQQASVAGAIRGFDFYNGASRLSTQNNVPNDAFHNATFAGNYGFAPDPWTDLRFTFRHLASSTGAPNAIDLFGIPDFSNQTAHETFLNLALDRQITPRAHGLVRYGRQLLRSAYNQFAPNGTLYTPPPTADTPNAYPNGYLGLPVTIRGANGYIVAGTALLDFPGTYPVSYPSASNRDFVYAQTDYRLGQHLNALGSFKYESERGGSSPGAIERGNFSYTVQAAGDVRSRLFYTLGSGIERNAVYGTALTPRVSLAFYAIRPAAQGLFSGTKLHASFGKGVKEPRVDEQTASLFAILNATPSASYQARPLGGEFSRTYDIGVEQVLGDGRARVNLTWFHNEFTNGIQNVPPAGLIALGVPADDPRLMSSLAYGAYVNSQAFRAMGAELEVEYRFSPHLFARAGYTYLDAVIQHSFSSDAFGGGTLNPAFPATPIGAYAPLNGARPFRRAPHSGYFALAYTERRFNAQLTGTLVGRRDDSTFLLDQDFGPSLLLPNRNLDGAYQRLALSSEFRLTDHLTTYADLQNLLNERFYEAFGFPTLPFNVRGGLRLTLGGPGGGDRERRP